MFDAARLTSGQRILIHAASGGVGAFAVQLAKAKGAFVTGTASGKNEDFVRGLGADEFVDYTTTRFEACSTLHEPFCALDVIINGWSENTGYLRVPCRFQVRHDEDAVLRGCEV